MTPQEIAHILEEERKRQNITYKQLTEEGWTDKTAQRIFHEPQKAVFENVLKMAERLGVEIEAHRINS